MTSTTIPYGVLLLLACAMATALPDAAAVETEDVRLSKASHRAAIESDWLRQLKARDLSNSHTAQPVATNVARQSDAAGAVDGVKNGLWGFHTANEANPWWQVDLLKSMPLDHLLIWNRCDPGLADRTSRLIVLLSDDAKTFRRVYQHSGATFFGHSDKKPLRVPLDGANARYVRIQLPGTSYFHLDEVEIHSADNGKNVALRKPATQSSTSPWSKAVTSAALEGRNTLPTSLVVQQGLGLADSLQRLGANVDAYPDMLRRIEQQLGQLKSDAPREQQRDLYLQVRRIVRNMALANPLLDFDTIFFVKRAPGMFPHVADQYYGWWSRGGGGICLLKGFKSESPRVQCLTGNWPQGSFLRPDLSYDGKRVLFAYAKHYDHVAKMNKVDKETLPEDCFYKIYEMNIDGSGLRQLTHGRYDDFDARYLPSGEIVFLSTRKGTALQVSRHSAAATCKATMPDSYVRCGGDERRPVSVFTLHRMDASGGNLLAISAFENFEWTPSITNDGRILYARWDYIDRFNGHFMSLWVTNPDGTNAQLVYGNYTVRPQCVFEARSIPNSHKLVFTATAHHSITGGSLVLLDPHVGIEQQRPLTRLTPEVPFPETERAVNMYYANPYPLSEDHYLVAWGDRRLPQHTLMWDADPRNPRNVLGLYLRDSFGNLELLYRDPDISSMYPLPVRPRSKPPVLADTVDWNEPQQGRFLLHDVYQGLEGIGRTTVKQLRVVGVTPKVQPHMNNPQLSVSAEDTGKFILGTVPVEKDGSAYFHVPSGIPYFFQALDSRGRAVQTMRSLTYVQPNQTLSCIGCHESRSAAPHMSTVPLAAQREPSKITPGPTGTWPLRYDQLVQPVLEKHCLDCHNPQSEDRQAARFDLSPAISYDNLLSYGDKDLHRLVFERDLSIAGETPSLKSKLLAMLTEGDGHQGVKLDSDSLNRLTTWMDTYAHRTGSFSSQQEQELRDLRERVAPLLNPTNTTSGNDARAAAPRGP